MKQMIKPDFSGLTAEVFEIKFPDDDACYAYLAELKWGKEGFVCRKCGNHHYCNGKRPHARRCTRCKSEESATVDTPFHRCRIPLKEAFRIAWRCCSQPGISSWSLSRELEIRQMTCWKFKTRIMECLQDNPQNEPQKS
ncbi:MAG TPA: transposase [Bacteroidales bacterium]|nr:transposase [Bacteroidales bacterium]HRZ48122.1 transposase [Bacteroidales bacterium]